MGTMSRIFLLFALLATALATGCNSGEWFDGQVCQPCSDCNGGLWYYVISECTANADTVCGDCLTNCKYCTGPEFEDCIICRNNHWMDYVTEACYPCQGNCRFCTNSTFAGCTRCLTGYFPNLDDQKCRICKPCLDGTYLTTPCNEEVPNGNNNLCADCPEYCATCTGPNFSQCSQCKAGYFNTTTSCTECSSCPSGKYVSQPCGQSSDTQCSDCIANCATCTGPNFADCSACASGFFRDSTSGTCKACGTCSSGQYASSACGGSTDVVCSACLSNCIDCTGSGFDDCSECAAGYYLDSSTETCKACSTACPSGEYISAPCGGTSDISCSECSTCGAAEYVDEACTSTSDTVCAPCAEHCTSCYSGTLCFTCEPGYANYQTDCRACYDPLCAVCITNGAGDCHDCFPRYYIAIPGGCQPCAEHCHLCWGPNGADCDECDPGRWINWSNGTGTCDICSTCSEGEYMTRPCVETHYEDVSCAACATCEAGKYVSTPCSGPTGTQNTVCSWCTECGTGKYVDVACSTNADTVCGDCIEHCADCNGDSFSDCNQCEEGYYLDSGSNACTACTAECGEGKYKAQPCSTSANTVCNDCTECGSGEYEAQACSSNADAVCGNCIEHCTNCNGDSFSDCSQCAEGYYLDSGSDACAACTAECGSGKYKAQSCSTGADTVCNDCTECGSGEYEAEACSANTDTVCGDCIEHCASCDGGTFSDCSQCDDGYYLDSGTSTCAASA